MARLFVALALPQAVRGELAGVIETLKDAIAGPRWIPAQNLHLTLAFLGRVDEERVGEVSAAIAAAVRDHLYFTVGLGALGAFPSTRRARVLFAGLDDPTGGLAGLAGSVAEALEPLGFPREARAFQSHVTIARLKPPAPVELELTPRPLSFSVERIGLLESHLRRPAPLYEQIATFPFRRGS